MTRLPDWGDLCRRAGIDAHDDDSTSHLHDHEIEIELQANPDLRDAAQHLTRRYGKFVRTSDLRRRANAIRGR
jgi:hypothetical protein